MFELSFGSDLEDWVEGWDSWGCLVFCEGAVSHHKMLERIET